MRTLLLLAGCALALTVTGARADEEDLPIDKVPKPILDAVKKRFPKAELKEAAKETDGDKVEYEVTIKDGDTKIDVMLTPDGKITLIEKMIPTKDLPKAIADAVEAKYPKATVKIAEELIKVTDDKEAIDLYEVLIETADKKTLELKLNVEGKITETEEKKGNDKDDKDEKKDKEKKDKDDKKKDK